MSTDLKTKSSHTITVALGVEDDAGATTQEDFQITFRGMSARTGREVRAQSYRRETDVLDFAQYLSVLVTKIEGAAAVITITPDLFEEMSVSNVSAIFEAIQEYLNPNKSASDSSPTV